MITFAIPHDSHRELSSLKWLHFHIDILLCYIFKHDVFNSERKCNLVDSFWILFNMLVY